MKHRFILTFQTLATAKQARQDLLNALTSGGLHEPDLKLTAIPKTGRANRKRQRPYPYYRIIQ